MTGLIAEMRNVDHRRGIIGAQDQFGACAHGIQAFARFQDGQGAQKPGCIKFISHGVSSSLIPIPRPQRCDALGGDAAHGLP